MRRALLLLIVLSAPVAAAEESKRPAWKDYALTTTLTGHTSLVRSIAFSPDGKTLVTGGSDRALRIWTPGSETPRATHQLPRSG